MQPTADFSVEQENKPAFAAPVDSRLRWWLLCCASLGVIALLLYPFSVDGRAWSALFNFVHAPTFFCTFVFIAAVLDPSSVGLRSRKTPLVRLGIRRILLLAVMLFTGGLACEIAQTYVDRQASLKDAAANTCGIVAAAVYCSLFRISGAWRWFVFPPLMVVFLVFPGIEPLNEMIECYRLDQEFPLMASFERPAELNPWRTQGATLTRDTTWATHGRHSVKLQAQGSRTVSFTLNWPLKDWTGHSRLQVDVFNPTDSDLTLGISIGDRLHQESGFNSSERFSNTFTVDALQAKTISIDLQEIEAGPADRTLSMTEVAMVNFFDMAPTERSAFHLDNLRLVP